ncbi:MAG TPA: PAS domain S-box protein [Patescibacteria group bacterium]|nr:PAS domain S-box protein [Patescibacteria group bacterium]
MHSILQRQFKRVFGENVTIPPGLSAFLELISDTYAGFDEDRALLDRSLEISSKEYLENSRNLLKAKEEVERTVEERTENLQKYQTLLDNLSVGVYRNTPGPQGHFLEANPAIISIFEADSKEEFIKHDVSDFYQDPAKRNAFVEKITKYGFVKNEKLDLITLKGKKIIGSVSAVMKKSPNGDVYFDGVIEDITDHMRMEQELKDVNAELETKVKERTGQLNEHVKELENVRSAMTNLLEDLEVEKKKSDELVKDLEKFKLALDNASDMVVITDPEGTVIYGNRTVEKITGYKPEEAVGKKSGVLWKSPMPPEFYRNMWDVIKNRKQVFTGEIRNKRKSGELYTAEISISPVLSREGEVEFFVGIERDITHEKEIDKAKSEFISIASHQLRTPLGIMKWYLEALQSYEYLQNAPGEIKDNIDQIYKSNERVLSLVRALLSVSRIDQDRVKDDPKPVDIIEMVKEVVEGVKILADKKTIGLTIILPEEKAAPIQIDPLRLHEVLDNLVINAIRYTPVSGKVEVIIEKSGAGYVIKIKDTGIGISEDDKKKLFTKFFRGEKAVGTNPEGTGLGLYVVKSYVEGWGGGSIF